MARLSRPLTQHCQDSVCMPLAWWSVWSFMCNIQPVGLVVDQQVHDLRILQPGFLGLAYNLPCGFWQRLEVSRQRLSGVRAVRLVAHGCSCTALTQRPIQDAVVLHADLLHLSSTATAGSQLQCTSHLKEALYSQTAHSIPLTACIARLQGDGILHPRAQVLSPWPPLPELRAAFGLLTC